MPPKFLPCLSAAPNPSPNSPSCTLCSKPAATCFPSNIPNTCYSSVWYSLPAGGHLACPWSPRALLTPTWRGRPIPPTARTCSISYQESTPTGMLLELRPFVGFSPSGTQALGVCLINSSITGAQAVHQGHSPVAGYPESISSALQAEKCSG